MMIRKKLALKSVLEILFLFLVLTALTSCTDPSPAPSESARETSSDYLSEDSKILWLTAPLTDVRTNQVFTINDFKGKPILVESFAVWCPICTKQQQEIQKLHEDVGESVVSISLDTDANEDAEKVREAAEERGFTWRFAVSPPDLTEALIQEFGSSIVNAPSAPVILVCEDQSARLLERGTKSVEELKAEIQRGC